MLKRNGWKWLGLACLFLVLLVATGCGTAGSGSGNSQSSGAEGNSGAAIPSSTNAAGGETKEDQAEFFKGKTVTWIVPYKPGGGYDAYPRMIAPFFGKYLGGADVIIENEPSSGGMVGFNKIYTAKPDGLTVGIYNGQGSMAAQIAEAEGVRYDLGELSWIGRIAGEPLVFIAKGGSDLTIDDLFGDKPIRFGATGPGSAEYMSALLLQKAADANLDVIKGFANTKEFQAAIQRGDVDISCTTLDSSLPAIQSGELKALFLASDQPNDELPGVPTYNDIPGLTEEGKAILQGHINLIEMGRPVASPPGVPAERLVFMREAFEKALSDPELLAQAEQSQRPIDPVDGEEFTQIVKDILQAPEDFKTTLTEAYN